MDTCLIYDGKKELRLLKEPESEYIVLDAMTNTQLFEWFRERIKEREVVKRWMKKRNGENIFRICLGM